MWTELAGKLREQLEQAMGQHGVGTIEGIPVISWQETNKPRKFNMAAFRKAHPDLYEQFCEYGAAPRPFNEVKFELPEDEDDDDE